MWKLAQIIMLFKPRKDLHQTASYKPISLLSKLSEILENMIYSRFKPVMESKKLISDHQFGFKNKYSTVEPLHRLVDKIITFDKVWHKALLQTIKTHFPKQVQKLLASYLENRILVAKIKDTYSDVKIIKAGVPRGSVLGPILYTLYTDIPQT